MENAKLYSPHDIEQLKQKIDSYKKTLATLKKGTSIEDCIMLKNEFDTFKKQLLQLDDPTTIEVLQPVQFDDYEEQVKKMAVQMNTLHQHVEEINKEILTIFKKIIANNESNVSPINKAPTLQHEEKSIPIEENIPKQSSFLNKQPTFRQLQLIAGKASIPQNQPLTTVREETISTPPETRQYNQPHFQLTSTPPSQMYNGLFKNAAREPVLHFKNALDMQTDSVEALLSATSPPIITKQQPAVADASSLTAITSTTQSNEQNSLDHTAVNSTSILQESSVSLLNDNQTIDAMESEVTEDSLHLEPSDAENLAIEPNAAVDPISTDASLQHESFSSITNEIKSNSSYSTETVEANITKEEVTLTPKTNLACQDDELETITELESSTASSTFPQTTAPEKIKKEKGNIFFNLFRRKN